MLIFGALIGFALTFEFIALPMAAAMAAQLGVVFHLPIFGIVVPLLISVSVFVALSLQLYFSFVCYLIGTVAVSTSGAVSASGPVPRTFGGSPALWERWELLARGLMIGSTAAFNWLVLPIGPAWLFSWVPVLAPAMLVAVPLLGVLSTALMIVNWLTVSERLCARPEFEAVLGWCEWFMPSAFLANLIGVLILVVNGISWIFGARLRLQFEWWIGVWSVHGGIVHAYPVLVPLIPALEPTAYTLGNFIFIPPLFNKTTPVDLPAFPLTSLRTADGFLFHESGHTMNVAAFGSWWHLFGGLDEAFQLNQAYAELLAESHMHGSRAPWFPLWGLPGGLGPTTANAPATFNSVTAAGGPPPWVFRVGTPVALAANGLTDPDGFPLALADPHVNPSFTSLWTITPATAGQQFALPDALLPTTTVRFNTGGDYGIKFRVTDGMEGATASGTASIVEARANGPYSGAPGTPIQVTAAGSTAGSAGALPSVGGAPPLTLEWSIFTALPIGATGTVGPSHSETPTVTGFMAPGGSSPTATLFLRLTVTEPGGVSDFTETIVVIRPP